MKLLTRFFALSSLCFLAACAGMNQSSGSLKTSGTLVKPSSIYVKSFAPGSDWSGDLGSKPRDQYIQEQMVILDQRLVAQLQEIAPTGMAPATQPTSGLLITGTIKHVNAGSGAARYFVGGFGGGAREVVAEVRIYDMAVSPVTPVASFQLEGGSRGEGGIIGAVSNLDSEWDRIARETRNYIVKNAK